MTEHLLYLASGNSRRFGANKLLHPLGGKPLFRHGLDTLCICVEGNPNRTLTLVSQHGAIREQAEALGVRAVDSPLSPLGLSHTIRAAIAALGEVPQEDYLLFVLADQPHLSQTSVEHLLALAETGTKAASLAWGDRPGSPALFSARLIPELLALEGDQGGRSVLKRHGCVHVQAGAERELEDIDTPEDMN